MRKLKEYASLAAAEKLTKAQKLGLANVTDIEWDANREMIRMSLSGHCVRGHPFAISVLDCEDGKVARLVGAMSQREFNRTGKLP